MKILLILTVVFLSFLGCRKEEGIWDKLSQAEKDALQLRANNQCLADEEKDINDIINVSNVELSRLARNDAWKMENKQDTSILSTSKIYVWKISGNTVYFLISFADGDNHRYVKVNTTTNSEMFDDLRRRKCFNDFTKSSLDANSVSAEIEDARVAEVDSGYSIITNTYSYTEINPAFFGLISPKKVKKTYKKDDTVSATLIYTNTITRTDDLVLGTVYNSPDYRNLTYCVPAYTNGTPNSFLKPGSANYSMNCTSDPVAGVDANGDGLIDFKPSEELP